MSGVVTFEISGRERILMDREPFRKALRRNATKIAWITRRELRSGSHSGRRYSKSGRSWTASAPGEYPAKFTGNLARHVRVRLSRGGMMARVTIRARHTHLLFLGTSKLRARPDILADKLDEHRAEIQDDLYRALAGAFDG